MSKASISLVMFALTLVTASLVRGQAGNLRALDGSDKSIVQEIKALQGQDRRAALKGDSSFFEKYLTDDYVGIAGDGSIVTKERKIEMVKTGAIKYEAMDEGDLKIRLYGDTAIVNVLFSIKVTAYGKPFQGEERVVFVWVKQQGLWKEAFFQATRVAPRTPRPGDNLGRDARPAPP